MPLRVPRHEVSCSFREMGHSEEAQSGFKLITATLAAQALDALEELCLQSDRCFPLRTCLLLRLPPRPAGASAGAPLQSYVCGKRSIREGSVPS